MQLLELVRRHALVTALSAGLVAGAVVGLFLPIRAATPPRATDQAWAMPTAKDVNSYDKADYDRLRTVRFWGAADDQSRPDRPTTWSLQAIVLRPRPGIAYVPSSGSNPKPQWAAIGGKLPDGSILLGVDAEAARFEREGCRYSRRLFATAEEKNADPCPDAAPAADASGPAPAGSPPARSGNAGSPTRQATTSDPS